LSPRWGAFNPPGDPPERASKEESGLRQRAPPTHRRVRWRRGRSGVAREADPLAGQGALTPRNLSRHAETLGKNRNRYPYLRRYEQGLTSNSDSAISWRFLGRAAKFRPRHQLDAIGSRAPAATDLFHVPSDDRGLLDGGGPRHVYVPELRHPAVPDNVESGQVSAMSAAKARGVVRQCHRQNVP